MLGFFTLVFLSSCGVFRQSWRPETDKPLPAAAGRDSVVPLVRHAEIPQLQVDAISVYSRMIDYFTPETNKPVATASTEKLTAYICFPAGSIRFNPSYGNNRAELEKLKEHLSRLADGEKKIESVRLTGFASPDGSTTENERLAGNRAVDFKNYLQKLPELAGGVSVTIDWVGEDWKGLRKLIAKSGRSYTAEVLAILDTHTDADSRRKQLKALEKGVIYKDIEKSFFSRLRRMELAVTLNGSVATPAAPSVDLPELAAMVYANPGQLTLDELLQVATIYRPGTEQYREVYELAAYRFPDCRIAQLNAAAASLALGDRESARYFLQRCGDNPRSYINQGVLLLMEGDAAGAGGYFRKAIPLNPRLARENLSVALKMMSLSGM